MNLFNRIVVLLVMLLVLFGSALTIFGVFFWQSDIFDAFREIAAAYPPGTPLDPGDIALIVGPLIVLMIVALVILWFEIVPGGAAGVRLNQVSNSNTLVTTDAIMQRVRHDAEDVAGVRAARPIVKTNGRLVDVRLDLRLAPGVDVPPLVEEVGRTVREGVESKTGVHLRKLNIYVRHEPYAKAKPVRTAKESLL